MAAEPLTLNRTITPAGLTVAECARRYRVGQGKVRAWIDRGELRAINVATALCGRPRWVIPVEAIAQFEARRAGGRTGPKAPRRRRATAKDYTAGW